MHSQGEDIGEDHMEEEEDKSCGEPETTMEDTGGQVCPAKIKRVQGETQMQWTGQRKGRRQNLLCVWKVGPYGQKILGKMKEGESSRNVTEVDKRQ